MSHSNCKKQIVYFKLITNYIESFILEEIHFTVSFVLGTNLSVQSISVRPDNQHPPTFIHVPFIQETTFTESFIPLSNLLHASDKHSCITQTEKISFILVTNHRESFILDTLYSFSHVGHKPYSTCISYT